MTQDEGLAGDKTPGERAKEDHEAGLAGPERADRDSIGEGGAPTGADDAGGDDAPGSSGEDTQLQEQIIETARRMVEENPTDQFSGEDIAREVGLEPDNPAVREALKAGSERGELACQGWHGESGLPTRIHAGSQPGAVSRD